MNTKKLTALGLLTGVALILHIVEAQFPAPLPIPGVKLGLANIVTVFAVFLLGPGEGAAVLACRIFLGSVFGGNFSSILYAGAGGLFAVAVTIGLKLVVTRKQLWVAGILGAVAHSMGQILVALAVTGTSVVLLYLPFMVIISIFTGLFTGLTAQILLNRGDKLWKTIFK